jgi:hypothetical protein
VTFKELQKFVDSQAGSTTESNQILRKLGGKPFWEWGKLEHKRMDVTNNGKCCFNHRIGLPRKNGIEYPMFDYERMLLEALPIPGQFNSDPKLPSKDPKNILYPFKEKHLWIKKATGLGVTEFMLRFMAWLCLRDDDYRDSQMVIVTGPNQELAIKLIKRMKGLFAEKLSHI